MKTAVVFYSLDGNCALVAEEIKTQLNAELLQIYTRDDKKRGKIGKMLWGCGMVFSKKKPHLKPYTFNASSYDLIVLGAPVWAGSLAPPLQTFITESGITGKKIALFVCHGGGKGESQKKFKALLGGNNVVGEADFVTPSKDKIEEVRQKVADWVKGFK
jgi:flavodoxin